MEEDFEDFIEVEEDEFDTGHIQGERDDLDIEE